MFERNSVLYARKNTWAREIVSLIIKNFALSSPIYDLCIHDLNLCISYSLAVVRLQILTSLWHLNLTVFVVGLFFLFFIVVFLFLGFLIVGSPTSCFFGGMNLWPAFCLGFHHGHLPHGLVFYAAAAVLSLVYGVHRTSVGNILVVEVKRLKWLERVTGGLLRVTLQLPREGKCIWGCHSIRCIPARCPGFLVMLTNLGSFYNCCVGHCEK